MLHLNYCEFYITNVCNLACDGCNRFNNYKFKGFQRWSDHADQYAEWAKHIRITNVGILGGEPLLNVDFMAWLDGLCKLWPLSKIKIVTNGFYLNRVQGLYDYVKNNRKVQLWVGVHNQDHVEPIKQILEEFLTGPISYKQNRDDPYREFDTVTDANGVTIKLEYNWWFHQGAIKHTTTGTTLHQSDVETAHSNCHMKYCHHFIKGKLYKCGVVALLPEFDQQHTLELNADDRTLINSYQPLTLDSTTDSKKEFVRNLKNSIPQCRFCPQSYHGQKISAQEKRMVFQR
jgi:organic radical activating enzyme